MSGVDLLVAGAGAAGCAAALAAAERGRTVVLVDADEHFRRGCNTAMSTSMIPAAGSRWQRELGIDDTPERFYDDIMRKTGGQADPTVARALVDVAPRLVAWLADTCAVPLSLVTDFRYPGHSADRCHAVADRSGATLHAHLLDAVEAHERITLMAPMTLSGVEVEAGRRDGGGHGHGAVTAARVEAPGGATEVVPVDGAVLATNGYAADPDLVAEHLPEIAGGVAFGGAYSRGDALRIGAEVGAATSCLDAYQGHGSLAHPHAVLLTWATVMHGAVLVNTQGERFGDETVGYSEFGARTLAQPGGVAWMVYDERIHDAVQPFADYRVLQHAGAVRWCDDADALADGIGADPGVLGTTLAAARACAGGAADDPHGRVDWEAPLDPPYAAVRVTGALFHTQGGLRVDGDGRVLRDDGTPVDGLYAAGGAAVGISGHGAGGYLAGNGLLSALGLGYLAGRAAAGT